MKRRRSAKFKGKQQPDQQHSMASKPPEQELESKDLYQVNPVRDKQAGIEGCLPLAVILEIMATEYEEGKQGDALCRAAVRLAEESGEIASYRARWDAAQEDSSGSQSIYLFDRRQAMELIRYHQNKGNREALQKEKDKLKIAEGRLLLGQSPPLKITGDDLEKLEEFIRGHGF
ncbi:hypothetical protein ACOBQJ_09375 [Pelotomaculum propionicicum]|uniref:hypothetical protein n=1 Tax=Pelotomaculum propionicicum TaxID=258475 RepID=UPI003B777221